MGRVLLKSVVAMMVLSANLFSQAQQNVPATSNTVVPTLVNFSGALKDINGKPLNGIVGVTFLLYKDEQGGAPLWIETQNVTADKSGRYSVILGSTASQGLPTDLFASGEARWLGVQAQGQAEQPRVLLLSVPYALKAGDAQTVGGLPPSAFVLAAPAGATAAATANLVAPSGSASALPPASSNVTTTGGTANTIPLFTTATNIQNSILSQTGTTAINVSGKLSLPATGTATATGGKNSQPQDYVASVFNSGTNTAIPQTFQLQAEPAGNNTATASGTLNLLYASGTGTPAETGLKINNKGQITFAAGQTFPGTGPGTVKSVASGAGLTGGPITSTGTLSIATAGVSNAMLANPSLTIKAGTDLTGGGLVALGGSATLNLDTTKVPTLSAASNTFTGSIKAASFTGSGPGLTNVNASQLGGVNGSLFARLDTNDAFASDVDAGRSLGVDFIGANSGSMAPGIIFGPLGGGLSGISSPQSGPNLGALNFWTGGVTRASITGIGQVGIGTMQPYTRLHLREDFGGGFVPMLTLMNGGGGAGAGVTIDFDSYDPTPNNSPSARMQSIDDGNFSDSLAFLTKNPGAATNPMTEQVRIADFGALIVDSSGNNARTLSAGSAGGTGLIFGGTGSGEGIASCRTSTSTCFDSFNNVQHQFGLDFYTNSSVAMTILNNGDMFILGCTNWSNGDHQGFCPSDARLKTNIQPFPNVLDKLTQLQPVHFDWKSSTPPELRGGSGRQYGFIAQDVEQVFPEMASVDKNGYRRVNYGQLPYLLLQGVRELKANNDSLRAAVRRQQKINQQAQAEIAKLRTSAAATAATLARLDRSSTAKDAQVAAMRGEIEQLRKAQQQMAVLLARFAPPQSDSAKFQAEVRPAANSLRDRP